MALGIVAGMVLSVARRLGEFGATIILFSNIPGETQTISLAIYTLTRVPGGYPAALRLTGVSIIRSPPASIASEILARQISRRISGD
jgi:molybdate transport system permease protein